MYRFWAKFRQIRAKKNGDTMKRTAKSLILLGCCGPIFAHAQISSFQHVIVIVQENRTPDNLFQGLCVAPFGNSSSCSTSPTGSQYDIQTSNWVDKTSSTGTTQPTSVELDNGYDPAHNHLSFTNTCDLNTSGACRMDGGANNTCTGSCPTRPPYHYVSNASSNLNPYLTLATSYGWANYMFQTNQGPSFPAHQFLFGGTSAPSAADDAIGTFASENMTPYTTPDAGCIALAGVVVKLVTTQGERGSIFPCLDHETMADLFDAIGVSWKYYTESNGSIWTAPNAIAHICLPSAPTGGKCTGSDWVNDVVIKSSQILTDIGNCKLAQVNWVIPNGLNSDHPKNNTGGGPSWVASIVNAVGNNPKCKDNEVYWDNTAILITWDDWGGWYDHEPPTILAGAQGDYQYGFRVPFIVVSAYTSAAYVDNNRMDFGTILRFLEHNFNIAEGALNFADARATTDLTEFFNLKQVPRVFQTIPARLDANYFINDKTPPTDPDDY
jgi:phospholipase C